ncbi:hypothetical protein SBOR_7822 [Sclerotinia borealis F-4128]|uniref:Thioredoxin domain-containing protein n=1 Tax=Sclerotinia borealis (strain F-4128) TaxID=1432307 RepID=W9C4Y6_SCLBF|nr:hypothetical protein SBOR_7822 [Sclerotinia borealis F-4128]
MLPLKRISCSLPIPKITVSTSIPWARAIPLSSACMPSRKFASTPTKHAQNRIYTPIRYPTDLTTYLSISTSTSLPLLTLWTTSYCSTCKTIAPLLHNIIESGTGEAEGGVLYAEVEYDAPDMMDEGLGMRYMVTSVPMLVGFWRGEVMGGVSGGGGGGGGQGERLRSREIQGMGREGLEEWVRGAARKGSEWREGHPGGEGLFGGLWKGWGK